MTTKLHNACVSKNAELVTNILAYGDSRRMGGVDAVDSADCTPLHHACVSGCTEVVEILLKNGAQANDKTADGSTPLHKAARAGHFEAVDLLLRAGANPYATNSRGETAFRAAASAPWLADKDPDWHLQAPWGDPSTKHARVFQLLLNYEQAKVSAEAARAASFAAAAAAQAAVQAAVHAQMDGAVLVHHHHGHHGHKH